LRGRIVAVEPETADAATLVIRPGRGWTGHRPGQYVRVGVDVNGVRHWRAYSLTNAPRRDGFLSITVKAIPNGLVSNHLVRAAKPGDLLHLDQATGDFTMPESPDERPAKILFVTGGSGITPVLGMLRNHDLGDVVLVHSAPTAGDVIAADELRGRTDIRLIELHTDTQGMLDAHLLAELVPDHAERETWACGPVGLLDLLEEIHTDRADSLHVERFRPSVLVTGEGGTVTVGGKQVEAGGTSPILDAAESAGVLMPSGCRMGICYGCVLPLTDGAVRDLRTGTITEAGPGVLVQTCISGAAGNCEIGAKA
jgi:ferredoxin-NADP reductase